MRNRLRTLFLSQLFVIFAAVGIKAQSYPDSCATNDTLSIIYVIQSGEDVYVKSLTKIEFREMLFYVVEFFQTITDQLEPVVKYSPLVEEPKTKKM